MATHQSCRLRIIISSHNITAVFIVLSGWGRMTSNGEVTGKILHSLVVSSNVGFWCVSNAPYLLVHYGWALFGSWDWIFLVNASSSLLFAREASDTFRSRFPLGGEGIKSTYQAYCHEGAFRFTFTDLDSAFCLSSIPNKDTRVRWQRTKYLKSL